MSAFGPRGPWAGRLGYDSLVQTCSDMNVSEAEHAGQGEVARPTPCQALDHAGGYFLATGVTAAVYPSDVPEAFFETRETGFGLMQAVRHSARIQGCKVGWDKMPKPLGSDRPEWL